MINRRRFNAALGGSLLAGLSGCVTHQTGPVTGITDLPPGYTPDPATDEAGIWLACEKAEKDMRTAAARMREKSVNELVADMMCRMSAGHCTSLRTYVVRTGVPNATAYPNGMIQVWSGLLLRMKSESELAAILGHELAHYIRRHSLARMRDVRAKTDLAAFLGLGLAAMGGGARSIDTLQLLTLGSVRAFSRDNEFEADALGLRYMADAGYDPHACAAVWKRFIALQKASGEDQDFDYFLATHPPDDEREKKLTDLADQRASRRAAAPDRLHEAILPIRPLLLADEVNLGRFKQSLKLFDMLREGDPAPGDILFASGELYRKRGKDDDEVIALGFYHDACEAAGAPPEAFRMVGTIRWRRGEKDRAREYFRRYLQAKPDAGDREMIKTYLGAA